MVKIQNGKDSKLEPCGTPQQIKWRLEEYPLILTNWFLFSSYEKNQLLAVPLTSK